MKIFHLGFDDGIVNNLSLDEKVQADFVESTESLLKTKLPQEENLTFIVLLGPNIGNPLKLIQELNQIHRDLPVLILFNHQYYKRMD